MSRCLLATAVTACLISAAQAGQPGFVASIDGEQPGVYIRPHVVLTGPLQGMEHRVERADGFVCPDAFVIKRSPELTLLYVGGEPARQIVQIAPIFTVDDPVTGIYDGETREGRITEADDRYIDHPVGHHNGTAVTGVADFLVGLGIGEKTVHCQTILEFLKR